MEASEKEKDAYVSALIDVRNFIRQNTFRVVKLTKDGKAHFYMYANVNYEEALTAMINNREQSNNDD